MLLMFTSLYGIILCQSPAFNEHQFVAPSIHYVIR